MCIPATKCSTTFKRYCLFFEDITINYSLRNNKRKKKLNKKKEIDEHILYDRIYERYIFNLIDTFRIDNTMFAWNNDETKEAAVSTS